jgi:hypothetical protein
MAKDLKEWIHTSDNNIFIPKVPVNEIFTNSNGTVNFIEINGTTIKFNIGTNTISINGNDVSDIYIGTANGNKPIKAIYIGNDKNIAQLIWSK